MKNIVMIKRCVSIAVMLALLIVFAGCESVTVGSFASKYYNDDSYDSAVQEIMTTFDGYEGCTLKKVGYAGDKVVKAEADARGLGPEQIIVLTSSFTTDESYDGSDFEPDKTYEDYKWILTRSTSADPIWTIVDHGDN